MQSQLATILHLLVILAWNWMQEFAKCPNKRLISPIVLTHNYVRLEMEIVYGYNSTCHTLPPK